MVTEQRAGSEPRKLTGLGGWLIFFQINIICALAATVYRMVTLPEIWTALELIVTVACIILFYRRIKLFRIVYIPVAISIAVHNFVPPIDSTLIVITVMAFVIMVGTLFTSRRVENTFR